MVTMYLPSGDTWDMKPILEGEAVLSFMELQEMTS
jgi:hypothetical protein